VAILVLAGLAGASRSAIPRRLIDGSRPAPVPRALRAHGGTFVMTKLRVEKVKDARGLVSTCPSAARHASSRPLAERIGANGRDITFLLSSREIAGCDRSPRARALYGPWCGRAGWTVYGGRVSDPRLTVCARSNGTPVVAFGWINPVRHARWIVVDQPGFREVYPVAGRLPVRVATVSGIETARGTVFRTTQYDARGGVLAKRTVIAVIAS